LAIARKRQFMAIAEFVVMLDRLELLAMLVHASNLGSPTRQVKFLECNQGWLQVNRHWLFHPLTSLQNRVALVSNVDQC
jgi:hypothetical protein